MKFEINLHLEGQCTSGKNAVIVTRTGHRFPCKRFIDWRADAIAQIHPQLEAQRASLERKGVIFPIAFPVSVQIEYWAQDNRRRDAPGIIDALWHLIEKIGIVTDDVLLGGVKQSLQFHNCGVDKTQVGVTIVIKGSYESNSQTLSKQSKTRRAVKLSRSDAREIRVSRKKTVLHGNTQRH